MTPAELLADLPLHRRVREVILAADPRMSEYVKHGAVQFAYQGDLAAFVKVKDPGVTLMFYRGARIPGAYPHLEGEGPSARSMRFKDAAEIDARAKELADIVRAWCALQAAPPVKSAKPKAEHHQHPSAAPPTKTFKSQRPGNEVSKATKVTGRRIGGALRAEQARSQKRKDSK